MHRPSLIQLIAAGLSMGYVSGSAEVVLRNRAAKQDAMPFYDSATGGYRGSGGHRNPHLLPHGFAAKRKRLRKLQRRARRITRRAA